MTDDRFDAFMSYNHAADEQLAPVIERGLQRLAKPWYRLRAISVYRDTSDTGLTPSLWGTVQQRLDESGWLILLACPESAASRWVEQEVNHWCDSKGPEAVLLVLTGGELLWDKQAGHFSDATTALSPTVARRFLTEPLYLDLRWAKEGAEPKLTDARFRADIARLASPIRKMPPDELEGEDIRLQRKARRLARAAVATVAVLALAATIAAVKAVANAHRAEDRARAATARQLGLLALDMPASHLDEALLLSVVAADLDSDAGVESFRSSRTLLGRYSQLIALLPVGEAASDVSVRGVAVSANGDTVAATVQSEAGGTRLVQWDLARRGEPQPVPLSAESGTGLGFDALGRVLVGAVGEPWTVVAGGRQVLGDNGDIVVDDPTGTQNLSSVGGARALVERSGTLELIDVADGGVIAGWPMESDAAVAAISGDRAVVVSGSALHLVDAVSGDEVASSAAVDAPAAVDVLDDTVAAVSPAGELTVWTERGDRLEPAGSAQPVDGGADVGVDVGVGRPRQIAIAGDGSRVVVVGDAGTAIVDTATMEVVASGTGGGRLELDPSGRYAAVGGTTLTVWDVDSGARVVSVPDKTNAMAWSACTESATCRLVTAGEAIDVWEAATGRRTRLADQTNAQSVAITADGESVVSGGWGPTVAVWTLAVQIDDPGRGEVTPAGAPSARDPFTGAVAQVNGDGSVDVTSVDGTVTVETGPVEWMRVVEATHRLVTIDGEFVRLFDTRTLEEVPLDDRCGGDLVAVSPEGMRLVAHRASDRQTVVCDTTSGALIAGGTFDGAALPAEAIAVADDGSVALGGAGFVEYHRVDGSLFEPGIAVDARFGGEPVMVRALAVHAGRVAAGVRSTTDPTAPARVLLWNAASGGDAVQFDTNHTDIAAIALTGDQAELVVAAGRDSGSDDGAVVVETWEAETRRRLGRGLGGMEGDVVALLGDGTSITGTDARGRTYVWSVDRDTRREVCAIVGRPLRTDEWELAAGGVLDRYDYSGVCD